MHASIRPFTVLHPGALPSSPARPKSDVEEKKQWAPCLCKVLHILARIRFPYAQKRNCAPLRSAVPSPILPILPKSAPIRFPLVVTIHAIRTGL